MPTIIQFINGSTWTLPPDFTGQLVPLEEYEALTFNTEYDKETMREAADKIAELRRELERTQTNLKTVTQMLADTDTQIAQAASEIEALRTKNAELKELSEKYLLNRMIVLARPVTTNEVEAVEMAQQVPTMALLLLTLGYEAMENQRQLRNVGEG